MRFKHLITNIHSNTYPNAYTHSNLDTNHDANIYATTITHQYAYLNKLKPTTNYRHNNWYC
jgi:hypothetical protein